MARHRPSPARRDGAEHDARRHTEATTLYNDLVVSQTREHAVKLIERALLLAWIGGGNAYVLATSRRARLRAEGRRRPARRKTRQGVDQRGR